MFKLIKLIFIVAGRRYRGHSPFPPDVTCGTCRMMYKYSIVYIFGKRSMQHVAASLADGVPFSGSWKCEYRIAIRHIKARLANFLGVKFVPSATCDTFYSSQKIPGTRQRCSSFFTPRSSFMIGYLSLYINTQLGVVENK